MNSLALASPPQAIKGNIVKAGSSSSTRIVASRAVDIKEVGRSLGVRYVARKLALRKLKSNPFVPLFGFVGLYIFPVNIRAGLVPAKALRDITSPSRSKDLARDSSKTIKDWMD